MYKIRQCEPPLLEDICGELGSYRKQRGFTQTELGTLTGFDKTMISKVESSNNPTVGTLKKVYSAMGARIRCVVDDSADVQPGAYMDDLVNTIFQFADTNSISYKQAFLYLYRFGAIDFYLQDPLLEMELPVSETLESMKLVCRKNGGEITKGSFFPEF